MRALATVVVHRERLVAEAIASALDRSAAIAVVEAGAIAPSRVAGLEVAVVDADLPDAELTVARLRAAGVKVVALGTGVRADVQVPADGIDQRPDRGGGPEPCRTGRTPAESPRT